MNSLVIQKLSKNYQQEIILDEIDLSAKVGEVIALIGPSGCGKSTLLKCISGLEKPTSGEIKVNGNIGMVFQQYNLFQNLTVFDNICLPLKIVRKFTAKEAADTAAKVLTQVGLEDKINAYPQELSGGQSQRAAIARTIAFDPTLILFDEPTSALDPYLKKEVLELIRTLAVQKQRTIMLVTHELAFAEQIADRVLQLEQGKLATAILSAI